VVLGPALFDTSAESYFARSADETATRWLASYARQFRMFVSTLTVLERMRGYWMLLRRTSPSNESSVKEAMEEYLLHLLSECELIDFDVKSALLSAELMALYPVPAAPLRRSHRTTESRQERLSRWRFDIMIAATALVYDMPLIHNNPQDFEPLRGIIEMMPERFPGVGPLNLVSVKRLAA
jgi:predicted nucleic acid-binding protein